MRAVCGNSAGFKPFDYGCHLCDSQGLIGSNGAVTGHQLQAGIQRFFNVRRQTGLHDAIHHFDHQWLHFLSGKDRWHRFDHIRLFPEKLDLNAILAKIRNEFFQDQRLSITQVQGLRNQQSLNWNPSFCGLVRQFLIKNPFMGGMLIQQNQIFPGLTDDISVTKLPDGIQIDGLWRFP